MKLKRTTDSYTGMSSHWIVFVWRNDGGDHVCMCEFERLRKGGEDWRIEENLEQGGGRRGKTPWAHRLCSPNLQQAGAAAEKCVHSVTQIPSCLCTFLIRVCKALLLKGATLLRAAATGVETHQSQGDDNPYSKTLNSVIFTPWTHHTVYATEKKNSTPKCSKEFEHDSSYQLDSHLCNTVEGGGCKVYKVQTLQRDDFFDARVQHARQILIELVQFNWKYNNKPALMRHSESSNVRVCACECKSECVLPPSGTESFWAMRFAVGGYWIHRNGNSKQFLSLSLSLSNSQPASLRSVYVASRHCCHFETSWGMCVWFRSYACGS